MHRDTPLSVAAASPVLYLSAEYLGICESVHLYLWPAACSRTRKLG